MPRWIYRANLAMVSLCAGWAAVDGFEHQWWGIPVLMASGGMNSWIYQHYGRRPAPPQRADYAKIRRLELELGLRDPDPPPTGPFIRNTQPRPEPPPGTYCVCGSVNPRAHVWGCPFDDPGPGAPPMPRPPEPPGEPVGFREPMAAAAKWETCPVCLRRHAGRCAG